MRKINGIAILDTLEELTDTTHTAVVVVDMQNDFCHPQGHYALHGKDIASTQAIVEPTIKFVKRAQELGVFVVFIQQQTLPNGRSDSPSWLRFKCRDGKSSEYTLKDSWGAELVEGLKPTENDAVVYKYRSDAFVNTTLDAVLRSQGIKTLVITGTSTEGCVESTVRGASYHDYYVVPITDLVSSPNANLHSNSLELISARYPVAKSTEVLNAWEQKAATDH